jgi:flagellar motor switch protein FliM
MRQQDTRVTTGMRNHASYQHHHHQQQSMVQLSNTGSPRRGGSMSNCIPKTSIESTKRKTVKDRKMKESKNTKIEEIERQMRKLQKMLEKEKGATSKYSK